MFESEKATDAADLPHGYKNLKLGFHLCDVCGRDEIHPLHTHKIVEQASEHPILHIEHGS